MKNLVRSAIRPIIGTIDLLVLACLILLCGCNRGPELIPVSGQVNIDGKPLEHGVVTVWVKNYRPACGAIDKDGHFTLMTHVAGDGCVAGEYPVTISSQVGIAGNLKRIFAPERYNDPALSDLSVTVDQPRKDWAIDLTWEGDSHEGPYVVKDE
jgi:hypothetical protein